MRSRAGRFAALRSVLAGATLLACAAAAVLAADGVGFRAEVDATKVGLDDQFRLTVTLEGKSIDLQEEITRPQLRNLRIVGGPSVSTQMSFVNGAMSQARVYTWVLQAVETGKAEVGPLRANLADGVRTTDAIGIDVLPGSVLPRRERRAADPLREMFGDDPFDSFFNRRRREPRDVKLFVEAAASRERLYVGESLVLTYYLYTQTSVSDLQFDDAPAYPGFWSKDLERPADPARGESVTRDGEEYRRFPVFRKLLFPTKPGRLEIPAATLKIGVANRAFAGPAPEIRRATKPLAVEVEAVPGAPGFSGAVGTYRVSATIDRESVALGEAATVRFTVEGRGNLEWIENPPDLAIPGAKVYPPQAKSRLDVRESGIDGSRTWEFVVVPETSGRFEVPPLAFDYFDPAAKRIVHAETARLPFTVEAGAPGAVARAAPPAAASTARAGELRLRSELDLPGRGLPSPGARGLTVALLLALVAHGALWSSSFLRRSRARTGSAARPGRSVRAALGDLRRATHGGVTKEAASALIERAVVDVFGDVDEDPAGGADPADAEIREILRDVRFIRYAPQLGDYSEKVAEVAARAAAAIRRRS